MSIQNRIAFPLPNGALDGGSGSPARFAYVDRFVPLGAQLDEKIPLQSATYLEWIKRSGQGNRSPGRSSMPTFRATAGGGTSRPGEDMEQALRASDFGLIFKERTRIDPVGFAVGEHLMSLSLGPGEEVTIEQKVFSERQVTYEEATDSSQELDTERSSTYTTELSSQLTRQLSETRQATFDIGGQVAGTFKGVDMSVSPHWSNSVTDADQTTRSESVRQSATQSQRIAAKFRAQHKITIKVSETSRFEGTTKRVLRNANPFTPIDLIYFKILQRLRLSQERYGVRLCWAPFIPDPGVLADAALAQARAYYSSIYPLDSVSPERARPADPGRATQVQEIGWPELDHWGFWGDMSDDYEFTLEAPTGFQWDGDERFCSGSIGVRTQNFGARSQPPNVYLVSAGSNGSGGVRLRIHAGADFGGPGAHLFVNAKARFIQIAAVDPAYAELFEDWNAAHAQWELEKKTAEEARAAKVEAALVTWRADYWKRFDPAMSAMQLLVSNLFPAQMRDEGWEVDAWSTFFEFESGAVKLYPSWWSDRPPRDPSAEPSSFQNASWARVFLPIRPGYEPEALAWLVERRLFTSVPAGAVSSAIEKLVTQIEEHRARHFGGKEELTLTPSTGPCADLTTSFVCLGVWEEALPTDGTHLEVMLANTTAVDDQGEQSFANSQALLQQRAALIEMQGTLTDGVTQRVGATTPSVDVVMNVGPRDEQGS